jgi:alpha-1,6-mannosyltransferase
MMKKTQELHNKILKLKIIYLLTFFVLLIPTIGLVIYCLKTGTPFSKYAGRVWISRTYQFSYIEVIYYSIIPILAFVYYKGFRLFSPLKNIESSKEKMLIKNILTGAILFGLIITFTVPFDSSDIFGYVNRGVQQAYYNLNPYLTTLSQIPNWQNDLMFHSHWIHNPAPYGFFFIYLTKWICLLGGKHFFITFFSFKILNFLVYWGCCLLILKMGRVLNIQRPWYALYLFAWNPLILINFLGNGHNDLMMAFLLMASIVLLYYERWMVFSIPVLVLSVLIKYSSILAFPFVCYYFFANKKWKTFFVSVLLSAGMIISLARLYLTDLINNPDRINNITENATLTLNSLHSALYKIVIYSSHMFPSFSLDENALNITLKFILWSLFIIFFGFLNLQFWQKLPVNNKKEMLIRVIYYSVISMAVMIIFASSKFYSWYLGMFFPLIFLLEETYFIRRFVILLSVFQLFSFTPVEDMNILDFILPTLVPFIIALKFDNLEAFKKFVENKK